METCKSIKNLIDKAFSDAIASDGMSFILAMDVCCNGRKMFYFHKAKVVEWKMSVWRCNPFQDYPVRVVLESQSGLQLIYNQGVGLSIVNTKRYRSDWRKRKINQRFEQSLCYKEITFYQVN